MSTGVPDFITLEGPLYTNALVTAERARNEITGLAAVVLHAPAATAECLERAASVLRELSGREPPPAGLPHVLHDGVSPDGERVLVLDELHGEPAHDRLSRLEPLPEAAVLAVAQGHARILEALRELDYSGLRPWTWEVWWNGESGEYSFLGWEWLVKGRDAAGGDMRVAAALWIELATCVPPTLDLTVEWGPETWLALPLGTRRCLYEIWQGGRGFTEKELDTRLSEWSRQLASTPAEQLAEGRRLLEADQPGEALEWLDRAQRVKSPPREVRRAYSLAEGRLTGYVDSLLSQARKEVAGYYSDASRTLSRAIGLPHVDPQRMLKVYRWQAAAQALADAAVKLAAAEISSSGLRVYDLLEQPLLEALTVADAGDLAQAVQQIEVCMQRWEKATGIAIPQLKTLHAELSLPGLWREADDAERKGQFDRAAQILTASLVLEKQISYSAVLYSATGRPPAQQQRTLETMRRFAQADELARQAQERLDQGDGPGAQELAERAVALARDVPGKRVEYERIADLARGAGHAVISPPVRAARPRKSRAKKATLERQAIKSETPVEGPEVTHSSPTKFEDPALLEAQVLVKLLDYDGTKIDLERVIGCLQSQQIKGVNSMLQALQGRNLLGLKLRCRVLCKECLERLEQVHIASSLKVFGQGLEACDKKALTDTLVAQVDAALDLLSDSGYPQEHIVELRRKWQSCKRNRSQANQK